MQWVPPLQANLSTSTLASFPLCFLLVLTHSLASSFFISATSSATIIPSPTFYFPKNNIFINMQLFYHCFLSTCHHQISWVSCLYIFSLLPQLLFTLPVIAFSPVTLTEIALEKEKKDFISRGSFFYSVTISSISAKEFVPFGQVCLLANPLPLYLWCYSVQILFISLWPLFLILFCPHSSKEIAYILVIF